MTPRTKRIFLGATTLLALVALFWMRSLSSWRPVKLGKVNPDYYKGAQDQQANWRSSTQSWLSNDEQTLCVPLDSMQVDVVQLRDKQVVALPTYLPCIISQKEPEVMFGFENQMEVLGVRELKTGRLKRTYQWPLQHLDDGKEVTPLLSPDEKTLFVIDDPCVFPLDVQSGRSLRKIELQHHLTSISSYVPIFALSPDGTRLIGCASERQGRTWRLPSGAEVKSWTTDASIHSHPDFLSPNARVAIYTYTAGDQTNPVFFVDAATGKTLWRVKNAIFGKNQFFNEEIFVPQKSNCQVLDLLTGRIKRELPGPRQSDGFILRIKPDSIYTLNPKGEVLRWRAR